MLPSPETFRMLISGLQGPSHALAVEQTLIWASQMALVVKNPLPNTGDARDEGSIPGPGRSPGEGNGNPLQNSCLGNLMYRGVWWAMV